MWLRQITDDKTPVVRTCCFLYYRENLLVSHLPRPAAKKVASAILSSGYQSHGTFAIQRCLLGEVTGSGTRLPVWAVW
jgi:hypothetical protein